ncbi:MAG: SAM-dependent methyltransferase, partial [Blastococcus sp.]
MDTEHQPADAVLPEPEAPPAEVAAAPDAAPRDDAAPREPVPGAFVVGDRVQLTDPKGRLHTVVLE